MGRLSARARHLPWWRTPPPPCNWHDPDPALLPILDGGAIPLLCIRCKTWRFRLRRTLFPHLPQLPPRYIRLAGSELPTTAALADALAPYPPPPYVHRIIVSIEDEMVRG